MVLITISMPSISLEIDDVTIQKNDDDKISFFANGMNAFTKTPSSYDFTSDQADIKTNLTYDADGDNYYGANAEITLEMPVVGSIDHIFAKAIVKFNYNIYTIYDECNNSSFDEAKLNGIGTDMTVVNTETATYAQTAGTSGGSGSYLELQMDNDGAGWNISQKFMILYSYNIGNEATHSTAGCGIKLLGVGGGSVDLYVQKAQGVNGENKYLAEIIIDWTSKTAAVFIDGSFNAVVDLSSLTGNYFPKVHLQALQSGKSFVARVYYARIKTGNETSEVISYFTSNNKNDYVVVHSDNNIAAITEENNRGAIATIKLNGTISSSEIIIINDCSYIALPK